MILNSSDKMMKTVINKGKWNRENLLMVEERVEVINQNTGINGSIAMLLISM